MVTGYWQEVAEEEACKILALFDPNRKQRRKVMHMGPLNAAPTFVATIMKMKKERYTLAKERFLKILQKTLLLIMFILWVHSQTDPSLFQNSPSCP